MAAGGILRFTIYDFGLREQVKSYRGVAERQQPICEETIRVATPKDEAESVDISRL
jgi:hypothetical protein